MKIKYGSTFLGMILVAGLSGCGGSSSSTITTETSADTTSTDTTTASTVVSTADATEGPNPNLFVSGALVEDATTEDCVLSGGTKTTCYRISVKGVPANHAVGPFCPPTITSTATEGGIWLDGSGETYDVDGNFIVNLPTLYNDASWQLYDPATGKVKITDTQVACEAAAQPNVAEEYQNYCVECSLDYVNGGISETVLIPKTPVPLATPATLNGNVGISLTGVTFALAAPVDAILSAHTIAAFDDCGGHVNPHVGYHYHAATGCTESAIQEDGHATLLGYAMDGYGIYANKNPTGNDDTDLDQCRGHTDAIRGFHYHAAPAGDNAFIGCFHGEQGTSASAAAAGAPPAGGVPPTGLPPQ